MMKDIIGNQLDIVKPLRGFDFKRNVFSIDMDALTGKKAMSRTQMVFIDWSASPSLRGGTTKQSRRKDRRP